jgi:hypothetical protein
LYRALEVREVSVRAFSARDLIRRQRSNTSAACRRTVRKAYGFPLRLAQLLLRLSLRITQQRSPERLSLSALCGGKPQKAAGTMNEFLIQTFHVWLPSARRCRGEVHKLRP